MPRYEEDYQAQPQMRQKDLVLSTNEFCFIQSKTNGAIKTYTGPIMVTISQQESMVVFNKNTKRFEETADFEKARQLFTSAPEGWYAVLKNPTTDNNHPEVGKPSTSPELHIGKKINIAGPCSFSLFPGQMTKVIQGHRLRSNQYLVARVYDADAAQKSVSTIVDAEGKEIGSKSTEKYFVGQMLIIKGTEVSFYMPPTGIEVLPLENDKNVYVREAVTLERLEYAILKDEDGEKRYIHGPDVVFPKPTEVFVASPKGGNIFRALELSPISGIYVKVIADYTDENKKLHKVGEELFITGNEQMIYYPRTEHALIQYDGKYMHHAIAIPKGEGRYILDRLNGGIKTVVGPAMYLPDPRKEVVVKRKLSEKECRLLYPGNTEVLNFNKELSERAVEKMAQKGIVNDVANVINSAYSTSNQLDTLAIFEANSKISRGVSYTKPRTITLDTKFEGVVAVDVWTGYAINVVSKSGNREVVVGPATRLLDYDETVEGMYLSTGKPKTTDDLLETAFLRIDNNKIADIIEVKTSDFVSLDIKVSYCVKFLEEQKDKWFSVENYVKYLTDSMRGKIKTEIKKHSIQNLLDNLSEIVSKVVLGENGEGKVFDENGMKIYDVEVLDFIINGEISDLIEEHQNEAVSKALGLSDAKTKLAVLTELAKIEEEKATIEANKKLYEIAVEKKIEEEEYAKELVSRQKQQELDMYNLRRKQDAEKIERELFDAKLERDKISEEFRLNSKKATAEIEINKQKAYAQNVQEIIAAVGPDLVAALTSKANASLLEAGMKNMSPYAIANGDSVANTINTLLRGTSLEGLVDKILPSKE